MFSANVSALGLQTFSREKRFRIEKTSRVGSYYNSTVISNFFHSSTACINIKETIILPFNGCKSQDCVQKSRVFFTQDLWFFYLRFYSKGHPILLHFLPGQSWYEKQPGFIRLRDVWIYNQNLILILKTNINMCFTFGVDIYCFKTDIKFLLKST